MSNFNQNPIIITAPMTQSFWATLRKLGVLDKTMGKPISVTSIVWNDPGGGAQYVITDGSVSQNQLEFGDTPVDFVGADPVKNFDGKKWRGGPGNLPQGGATGHHPPCKRNRADSSPGPPGESL